jgi:hypothetical protein
VVILIGIIVTCQMVRTNHEVSVTRVSARCHTERFGTVARFLLLEAAGENSDSNKVS